ncbi:predicted GPI-anchored protein 58 [Phragmites australis]|uniref:predicted GPI-anchored protein 58 n=1 Tax=Phragmites australis TaxID=29695 RepID=UPI002D79BEEC|nr:predicted GPI-anchored protein 58 [Phragmites australis]
MTAQGVVVSSSKSPVALVLEGSISTAPNVIPPTSVSVTAPTPEDPAVAIVPTPAPGVCAPTMEDAIVAIAPTHAPALSAPTLKDPTVVTAPTHAPAVSAPTLEDPVMATASTFSARPSSPDFDTLSTFNKVEHDFGSSSSSRFKVYPSTVTAMPPSSPTPDAKDVDI